VVGGAVLIVRAALRDRTLATFRYTIKKGPYKVVYIVLPIYIYCLNNR